MERPRINQRSRTHLPQLLRHRKRLQPSRVRRHHPRHQQRRWSRMCRKMMYARPQSKDKRGSIRRQGAAQPEWLDVHVLRLHLLCNAHSQPHS